MIENIGDAVGKAYSFANERFPQAVAVFLGGSWANGNAHPNSDLDIVVFDETATEISFEGVDFQGAVVEVCVIPPKAAKEFFHESTKYRSAPVPAQVAKGQLIKGNPEIAEEMRRLAGDVLARGPVPITEAERLDLRYELTLLREDLAHASSEAIISLCALAHTQLSRAILDLAGAWRAERKALRRAVANIDAEFVERLDDALTQGCRGEVQPMISLCTKVLDRLGGPCRTYPRFSA
jgi:hypothetical protein